MQILILMLGIFIGDNVGYLEFALCCQSKKLYRRWCGTGVKIFGFVNRSGYRCCQIRSGESHAK